MKRVLGIIASPRKLGNCEVFIKEIGRNIPQEHELKLLRIHDFNLQECRGCYQCLYGEKCVIRDDIKIILDAMSEADAIILAAPTYFLGPNSSLKNLLDRGLNFYRIQESLYRMPSIGIAMAGIEGKEGYTLLGVNSFLKIIMSDIKMSRVVYSALPGEVLLSESNRALAGEMGKALFGQGSVNHGPACPLCGGDSFRFIEEHTVLCLLCSNRGSYRMNNGVLAFDIVRGEHNLFLSREDAVKHGEWLRMMKQRFINQISSLKQVREDNKDGDWIKPPPPIK